MKITSKEFNKNVSASIINNFAYKYIHQAILDAGRTYKLPGLLNFDTYASETNLMFTGFNIKKSTNLTFIANADYYNNVVTLKVINYYDDSANFIEIDFDEIESVIESGELIKYINERVEIALKLTNKLVTEYKKEHNLK